jgi:hypothetical protein
LEYPRSLVFADRDVSYRSLRQITTAESACDRYRVAAVGSRAIRTKGATIPEPSLFRVADNPPAGPGKHYGVTREQ